MTSDDTKSSVALYAYCSLAALSLGLSACNPVRLGASLRTGFGRPGETTSSSFTLPSNVAIRIEESRFDASSHTINGCGEAAAVGKSCLIGRQLVFGSANQIPKTYVTSIVASFGGREYKLDVSEMYDAWGNRPLEVQGSGRYFGGSCEDAMNCTLRGLFSTGAATYAAEWQIVDGVSTRTVLTDSSDVVTAFQQHIDPPTRTAATHAVQGTTI